MSLSRRPGGAILAVLLLANLAAWAWAAAAFHAEPALFAIASLAWLFGLRHAIDADHIAAIDASVRKLMRDGKGPGTAGLFFSLGHSTVVVVLTALIATAAIRMRHGVQHFASIGGTISTSVSVLFLLIMAVSNLLALRQGRRGGHAHPPRGILTRLLSPVFSIVRRPRDMYLIGLLFGLGFDTASEIALLGLSASSAAHGLAFWRSMALPALFTAGMSLIDTADSLMMVRAYGWALGAPARRRSYDAVLTGLSAATALLVGLVELAGLAAPPGALGPAIAVLNRHWSAFGFAICVTFLLAWLIGSRRRRGAAGGAGHA